jgi:Domain of unknown function (DUF1876)
MNKLDVWTVSIMFCGEHGKTRADAFLQGPAVEVECTGWADPDVHVPIGTAIDEDLAAARALEILSRRLVDRSGTAGTRHTTTQGDA